MAQGALKPNEAANLKTVMAEKIRERIQKSIEKAEQERTREQLKRRITIAKEAIQAFEANRMSEAISGFLTYIKIIEDWKKVKKGGLRPEQFNKKKDITELLLISAIYWDLAKLFDYSRSKERRSDFLDYLDKFYIFSKGMPFEPLSAELIRKYVERGKGYNRDDFKAIYKRFGMSSCFVATALFDVSPPGTLEKLQRFRDERLVRSFFGRQFITLYYHVGPGISVLVKRFPKFLRIQMGTALGFIARILGPISP